MSKNNVMVPAIKDDEDRELSIWKDLMRADMSVWFVQREELLVSRLDALNVGDKLTVGIYISERILKGFKFLVGATGDNMLRYCPVEILDITVASDNLSCSIKLGVLDGLTSNSSEVPLVYTLMLLSEKYDEGDYKFTRMYLRIDNSIVLTPLVDIAFWGLDDADTKEFIG